MISSLHTDGDFQQPAVMQIVVIFGIQRGSKSVCTKLFEKRTPEISLLRLNKKKRIDILPGKVGAQIPNRFDLFGSRTEMPDGRS